MHVAITAITEPSIFDWLAWVGHSPGKWLGSHFLVDVGILICLKVFAAKIGWFDMDLKTGIPPFYGQNKRGL